VKRFGRYINYTKQKKSPTPSLTELAPSPLFFVSPTKSDDSYVKRQKRRTRRNNRRKTQKIVLPKEEAKNYQDQTKLEFEIVPENDKPNRTKSVLTRIDELEKMLESTENIIENRSKIR